MGPVAASGGYYISLSADRIVAQPATLTGSIGVLTGKVSVNKTLGLAGVDPANTSFRIYPRQTGLFGGFRAALGGMEGALGTLSQIRTLLGLPGVREVVRGAAEMPRGAVELRAPGLARQPGL
jgi:hypothetical protein